MKASLEITDEQLDSLKVAWTPIKDYQIEMEKESHLSKEIKTFSERYGRIHGRGYRHGFELMGKYKPTQLNILGLFAVGFGVKRDQPPIIATEER